MKLIFMFIVLFGVFATSFAAVSMGFFNNPKYPGKCTINENLILSPGEHKDPDTPCGRILCSADGSAEFQTCGVTHLAGCEFGDYKNPEANYPDCCERNVVCA